MNTVSAWNVIRHYDFQIYYYLYELSLHHVWLKDFFYYFAKDGILFFFLSFVYLIVKKKIPAFLCTLFAMGVAGAVDFFVFIFWRRPRPFVTYDSLVHPDINGMYTDISSFPSSHTYIVFAIATSVFLYGHRKLGIVLFLLAICVALGRSGAGLHYPSDVIGGAVLGILSGWIVYLLFNNWEKTKNKEIAKMTGEKLV